MSPAVERAVAPSGDGARKDWPMMLWLRHLLAIALLPFTATVIIPLWIARRYAVALPPDLSLASLPVQAVGLGVLAVGGVLFVSSVRRFQVDGRGTLAPWDPPRQMVVRGPYRYVRNPMISGVIFILFGEALLLCSVPHATWAALFLLTNLVYIPLLEEPQLRGRFGPSYVEYCRHVPRFVPRPRPWTGAET